MTYVSTSCIKNPQNVINVLKKYEQLELENVELGSVHAFFDLKQIKNFSFNYTIHNYFPPPEISFNFNLASKNKKIRTDSIKLAKNAIELASEINAKLYSFHAGFTVDPRKLGGKFSINDIQDRDSAIKKFTESVSTIVDYAKSRGIKLAMEPNVVQKFNLTNNKNELLLYADEDEIEKFYKNFSKKNIGILLDLGHTNVTSHWLRFDRDRFVENITKKVVAIHISNNNGLQDQHKPLTKNCWMVKKLKNFKNIPIILESMKLSGEQIRKNIEIIENAS